MEIWKDIKNFENKYQVSNKGKIRSLNYHNEKRIKILKPYKDIWGYLRIDLCKNGIKKHYKISRLVAQEFLKKIENKNQINHKDGNKENNLVENLEWCSPSENCIHAHKNNLRKAVNGENHYNHKLKKQDVIKIRNIYKNKNITYFQISKIFNISQSCISKIIRKQTWRML